MKAFEKLEKTQQRKQEQKTAKSSPKKPRNAIQKASLVNAQKRKMISQKRKKRKSKTNSRKSESKHSGESDVPTSSEETRPGTSSILKAPTSKPTSLSYSTPYHHQNEYKMSSAELLMSYTQIKNEPDRNLSGIPPLISPACMLIESVIGDMETTQQQPEPNEFKFPQTKPKKTIMNEWFGDNVKDEVSKAPEYKVNFKPDMNMVAATVEEFLGRNNIRYDEEPLSLVKNEYKPLTTPPQANSPQTENISFGSESAVKKRWLRQAISEETADESNAAQAELSTPLKKRRVFIEPEEESQDTKVTAIKEEPSTTEIKIEEDATVSSTVEENTTPSGLLAVSDVLVEAAQVLEQPESQLIADIVKEEDVTAAGAAATTTTKKEEEVIDEDNKSSNSEEMAEYQKVIASFHNENIMMLQTRNKKSKSFSGEPETSKVATKLSFDMDEEPAIGNKRRLLDDAVEPPTKSYRTRSPSPESTSVTESAPILAQTLTSVPETRHVTETIPFGSSRYLNNIRTTDEVPSILQTTTPPVIEEFTPTTSLTTFGYRPMMTNLTMNEYPDTTGSVVAPPPGTYLTSYNKATLITDPKAPIGSTLTGQFATVNTAYPSSFATAGSTTVTATPNVDQSILPTTPSSFLGKSYSTLNDSAPFYGQKIFTKTSSSDPRLNPALNPLEEVKPSPIPKKKVY